MDRVEPLNIVPVPKVWHQDHEGIRPSTNGETDWVWLELHPDGTVTWRSEAYEGYDDADR